MRLLIATAPEPWSHAARYWIPTETLLRNPCSVTSPGVACTSRRSSEWTCHVLALPLDLVGPVAEHPVERLHRDGHQVGVRDPRAVEALRRLAVLVLAHLLEGDRVHLGVAAGGDERRHAAHRVRVAPVAGLHQQLAVGAHEGHGHRHRGPVGKDELGAMPELLDHAEDVVPASRVEPGGVLAQLVEDLVHLERGEDRLDQDGRLDRPARHAEPVLRPAEHVVPEACLEMRLQLGEVEVAPVPAVVAQEVEAEVEQRAGHRRTVDLEVALLEVPAAGADEEHGDLVVQRVALLARCRARSFARARPSGSAVPRCSSPRSESSRPRSPP